jgi:hypothetical protein
VRRDYGPAFEKVDAVAMPTSPTPAFKIGERIDDPLELYLVDVFTVSANLAGLPALSVPCGLTQDSTADRSADDRPAIRRSDAAKDWRRLRAGYALVEGVSCYLRSMVQGAWCRVRRGSGFRVRGSGFGVRGSRLKELNNQRTSEIGRATMHPDPCTMDPEPLIT